MKIFRENGKIRFQLKNMITGKMLFDFTIREEEYEELKIHMISSLKWFKV